MRKKILLGTSSVISCLAVMTLASCSSSGIDDNHMTDPYNGHEYVDLGLSVKWATYNIGATKPEEFGDYFAWGETQPKSYFNWENYKFTTDGGNTLTKYTGND